MDWKKLKEEQVYKGYRGIVQKTFLLPNGKTAAFDIIDDHSFVSIVAVTEDQQFILVDQYRPGPEKNVLSFPAGYLEPGEAIEDAASRELLEETGFEAKELHFLKEVTNPYSHITKYSIMATGCRKTSEQNLDELEFVDVQLVSLEELKGLLVDPESKNFANLDCGFLALNKLNKL